MTCIAHDIDPYTTRCRRCGRSQRDIVFDRNPSPHDEGEKLIPNRHPNMDMPRVQPTSFGMYSAAQLERAEGSPLRVHLEELRRTLDDVQGHLTHLAERLGPITTPRPSDAAVNFNTNERDVPMPLRSETVNMVATCTAVAEEIRSRIQQITSSLEV